jgi:dual-specificity kinase
MKSDIWSMACIFAELYTGEMFFSTHENIEHLALIEKACGPVPFHMADRSSNDFKKLFNLDWSEEKVKNVGMRLDWPTVSKRKHES